MWMSQISLKAEVQNCQMLIDKGLVLLESRHFLINLKDHIVLRLESLRAQEASH